MTKIRSGRASGVLVLVLALVNGAAVWGQAGWALGHIVPAGWPAGSGLALSLAFAAAIELIGVFLAMMADQGEDVELPSGGVRLGSYAVGLVSGSLNFSHWYASGVSAAIAFGFLSAVSPFLWGIWSRVRRGRLAPPSRHFWHPVRSVSLIREMAWHGLSDEDAAVRALSAATPGHPDLVTADMDTPVTTDRPWADLVTADTDIDPVATRPSADIEAWDAGYERAIDELSADIPAEAEAWLSAVATDRLPQRTRRAAGSVPDEFVAMVTLAWDPSALPRADMVALSAAHFGVSTRTVRRWLALINEPISGT